MSVKKAYLTIDDGPSTDFTNKMNFLLENKIPAIWFCVGELMLQHEDEIINAIHNGFIIGNHSYNHPYFSDLTLEECKESILKTDQIIESIYEKSGHKRPIKVFRFPFFDQGGHSSRQLQIERKPFDCEEKRQGIQDFLKELGYVQPKFEGINFDIVMDKEVLSGIDVRCTYDQMEYCYGREWAPDGMDKAENILARIEADAPSEGKTLNCKDTSDIILIHDHDFSKELFYQIVNRYLDKGIKFQEIEI